MRAVLLEWIRAAELSCDRAATLAVRDPQIVCRTLMVIAGGMPADQLNLDAFMAQAMEYENWEDSHDRVRRFFNEIGRTHPNAVRRVSEVMRWVQSGEYDRIMRGEYRRRGDETNVREEAGDAMEFYAERFRAHVPRDRRERHQRSATRWATPASRSPTGCATAAAPATATGPATHARRRRSGLTASAPLARRGRPCCRICQHGPFAHRTAARAAASVPQQRVAETSRRS